MHGCCGDRRSSEGSVAAASSVAFVSLTSGLLNVLLHDGTVGAPCHPRLAPRPGHQLVQDP